MSRILEALKQIESKLEALKQIDSKQSLSQPAASTSSADDPPAACVPIRKFVKTEGQTPEIPVNTDDSPLPVLHPLIQAELDELNLSQATVEKQVSGPASAQTAAAESSLIDETLARAESAVTLALSANEPDTYHEMAQYILAAIPAGRSAVLLFTSPGEDVEKIEMLFALSKALLDHFRGEVLLLDAECHHPGTTNCLPSKVGLRYEQIANFSGDWEILLRELKTLFQLVLINAPSLANALTAPIISHCDGVYLAIGLGYATPGEVREALSVIQQAGGRLLGSIAVD